MKKIFSIFLSGILLSEALPAFSGPEEGRHRRHRRRMPVVHGEGIVIRFFPRWNRRSFRKRSGRSCVSLRRKIRGRLSSGCGSTFSSVVRRKRNTCWRSVRRIWRRRLRS